MANKGRKMWRRVPFHRYLLGELASLLVGPRNSTTAQHALNTAKLIRSVEIPVLHRDQVLESLQMVMAYFRIKNSKMFTRTQRSQFYGAVDALKEKAVAQEQQAQGAQHAA